MVNILSIVFWWQALFSYWFLTFGHVISASWEPLSAWFCSNGAHKRTFGAVRGQCSIMPAQKSCFENRRYLKFSKALSKNPPCKSCSSFTQTFFDHSVIVCALKVLSGQIKHIWYLVIFSISTWIHRVYGCIAAWLDHLTESWKMRPKAMLGYQIWSRHQASIILLSHFPKIHQYLFDKLRIWKTGCNRVRKKRHFTYPIRRQFVLVRRQESAYGANRLSGSPGNELTVLSENWVKEAFRVIIILLFKHVAWFSSISSRILIH